MKKAIMIATALVMTLALAACGSISNQSSEAASSASAESASSASDEATDSSASAEPTESSSSAEAAESSASAGLANPWMEAKTADEAGEAAGVGGFQVPEDGTTVNNGPINWYGFQYMDMLAEADGAVGAAELTIRKGVKNPAEPVSYDTSDVSGDYNDYKFKWDIDVDFWKVECFGNEEGKTMKAIWTSDNFSYSIEVRGQGDFFDTFGLGDEDIATIVQAVM